MRIRLGIFETQNAKGTVFVFPGRTEYVEKYGPCCADLGARGYASISIDWRGQGLADRMLENRNVGHVVDFLDYQKDVAAMVEAAHAHGLPEPFYLLAHSMGGCIGLRSLIAGNLRVAATAFSAPMWGIEMSLITRPIAWALPYASTLLGQGHHSAPSTSQVPYVLRTALKDNGLTTDLGMYNWMIDHLKAQPDLGLGGPSLTWLGEALNECRALTRYTSPSIPCLTVLGTNEGIVDPRRIHDRIGRWPAARLEIIEGALHETLMEGPELRREIMAKIIGHYDVHGSTASEQLQEAQSA